MLINHGITCFLSIGTCCIGNIHFNTQKYLLHDFFMLAQIIDIWLKSRDVLSGKGK